MKLVLDTNTLISGSLWQGPPARLLSATFAGRAQMFLSLPLLLELREVLQHPKFAERLAGRGETPDSIMIRFRTAGHESVPARIMPPSDLLVLGSFAGIPIITVAEALQRLGLS